MNYNIYTREILEKLVGQPFLDWQKFELFTIQRLYWGEYADEYIELIISEDSYKYTLCKPILKFGEEFDREEIQILWIFHKDGLITDETKVDFFDFLIKVHEIKKRFDLRDDKT